MERSLSSYLIKLFLVSQSAHCGRESVLFYFAQYPPLLVLTYTYFHSVAIDDGV